MTSVSSRDADVTSSTGELDFERRRRRRRSSSEQHATSATTAAETAARRGPPDVELLRRAGRRRSQATVEFRDDVPDSADAADDVGRRRRVSLKLDAAIAAEEEEEEEADFAPGVNPTLAADAGAMEMEKPLSSGWAAALAAASAAGSVRAAAKRRTNVGRTNAFVPPPTRSLLCLSLTNPLRKLTISVVEWKYPFLARDVM